MSSDSTTAAHRSDLTGSLRVHLPRELQFFLNDDAASVISTDYDYYRRCCAVEIALFSAGVIKHSGSESLFKFSDDEHTLLGRPDAPQVLGAHELSDAFLKLHHDLDAKLKTQLDKSSSKFVPTIERLLAKMRTAHGAPESELRIFRFLAIYQVAPMDSAVPCADKLVNSDGYGRSSARFQPVRTQDRYRDPPAALFASPSLLNYLFTLQPAGSTTTANNNSNSNDSLSNPYSLPNILSMFTKTSAWVKARLLPALQHPDESATSQSSEAYRLIVHGLPLTPTTFHQIESSLLQDALAESPAFLATEAGKAHLQQKASLAKEAAAAAASSSNPTVASNPLCEALRHRDRTAKDSVYQVFNALAGGGGGASEASEDGMEGTRTESLVGLDRQDSTGAGMKKAGSVMDVESSAVDLHLSPEKEEEPQQEQHADPAEGDDDDDDDTKMNTPYSDDLDYLTEMFRVLLLSKNVTALEVKLESSKMSSEGVVSVVDEEDQPSWRRRGPQTGNESVKLEADVRKAKSRLAQRNEIVRGRLRLTAQAGSWYPRLEILSDALKLTIFERNVVLQLVKNIISPERGGDSYSCRNSEIKSINDLQNAFCATLKERMASRSAFYKSGNLISSGIIFVSEDSEFTSDLSEALCIIDKRMVDLLCGQEAEFSELCSASHLYTPTTSIDDVILPDADKKKVMDCVQSFDKTRRLTAAAYENGNVRSGTALLFYGPSGTGKTLLANAIAASLKKKVLLVNFPSLGSNSAGTVIRYLFRESRINKSILFFDEAEALFSDRERTGLHHVNTLLTEMERFDGLVCLATNLPSLIDEAMIRRIHLSVAFSKPDHIMREKIWHVLKPNPAVVPLDASVDINALAIRFELTGGMISNAARGAISHMVSRNGKSITQEDLILACGEQIRGRMSISSFDNKITPKVGLDALVVEPEIMEGLQQVLNFTKAQSVLMGQWGFVDRYSISKGISVLLTGVPGTGKSHAASCLAFELGKPVKSVNVAQILSKWVGESEKNLCSTFQEARAEDALLIIDEAESLFGSRNDASSNSISNVGVLLQLMEQHEGVTVVITNMRDSIDVAFVRRFRFIMDFKKPTSALRQKLWSQSLPPQCPKDADVDFGRLATGYELTGAEIKQVVLRAATRAALRPEAKRKICMADLEHSCKEELEKKKEGSEAMRSMYM